MTQDEDSLHSGAPNKGPQSGLDQGVGSDVEQGLEELAESLPSPAQERARIALEILEGRRLDKISVRNIERIRLNESPEKQVDRLKHLYGASVLLVAFMVKKGRLDKSFGLSDIVRSDTTGLDLSTEQRAALGKLGEMSGAPSSEVTLFWNEMIMGKLQESVSLVSASADAALDVVNGTDSSPAEDASEEEKSIYSRTWKLMKEHPFVSTAIIAAGALGVGLFTKSLINNIKEEGPLAGAKSTGKSVVNWFIGGIVITGGLLVAGQVMGTETVQKWIKEKGWDDNEFLKALILFSHFDFLEGAVTLRKGVRGETHEELHRSYAMEYGLKSDLSIWLCGDQNFKEFMDHDYTDGHSIAAGGLADIPLIGRLFKDKRQVSDERILQGRLREHLGSVQRQPGWEKMTINQVMELVEKDVTYNPDSDLTTKYTTEPEREELRKQREAEVEQPSSSFDAVLDSVEPEKGITRVQKKKLLDELGEENGLLADLEYMEDQIPIWYRRLAHYFNDTVIGGAALAGAGEEGAFGVLGPDIDDSAEFFDKEASVTQLEQFFKELGVTDMELVSQLIVETRSFKEFEPPATNEAQAA